MAITTVSICACAFYWQTSYTFSATFSRKDGEPYFLGCPEYFSDGYDFSPSIMWETLADGPNSGIQKK
jgi:hypothetical protein